MQQLLLANRSFVEQVRTDEVGMKSADDMWEVTLFGRNMFNEHYNVVAFNTPAKQASGTNSDTSAISVFPGDPATFGITLTLHH